MIGVKVSDDYKPVGWIGRHPVYLTTLLVMVHVAALILASIWKGMGGSLESVAFSSDAVFTRFAVWQFGSYAFVHSPDLWFGIEMLMLFWFGREVERFLGRRAFLLLYFSLLLIAPMVLVVAGLFTPTQLVGSSLLHFSVFVAFAAIYPNAQLFLGLLAKWVAAFFLGILVLQAIWAGDMSRLVVVLAAAASALICVRYLGVSHAFGWLDRFTDVRSKALQPRPRSRPVRRQRARPPKDVHAAVDPLLEKISREGFASLTEKERETLNSARTELLRMEKRK